MAAPFCPQTYHHPPTAHKTHRSLAFAPVLDRVAAQAARLEEVQQLQEASHAKVQQLEQDSQQAQQRLRDDSDEALRRVNKDHAGCAEYSKWKADAGDT